jgi:hypothetical protein
LVVKPYTWSPDQTLEEQKNGAYWERNMLALHCAIIANESWADDPRRIDCGWYMHGEWEGWSRVISLYNGQVTFHIPDDFDIGNLREIEPNWDGHTTDQKWLKVMKWCGILGDSEVKPHEPRMG